MRDRRHRDSLELDVLALVLRDPFASLACAVYTYTYVAPGQGVFTGLMGRVASMAVLRPFVGVGLVLLWSS